MKTFAAAVLLGLSLSALIGAVPYHEHAPVDYGPTGTVWCQQVVLDANSTTVLLPYSSAAATPAVIGWGSQVRISSNATEGHACFVMAREATLGSQTTGAATTVTDAGGLPNGSTVGACPAFAMGDSVIEVPKLRGVLARGGARLGVCTSVSTLVIDEAVYPPCDADADCTAEGSAGTCVVAASDTQLAASGAMVILRGKQGGEVTVCVKR